MISSSPLVSVCIPVYNCEKFIGSAIDSVLSQTFRDFELLIVDDCSTDGTSHIVKQYHDPRIRYVVNDANLGLSGNWNKALSLALGSYIKILCDDDVLYPDCLKRQVDILDNPEHTAVALVCCGRDVIDESGNRIMNRKFGSSRGRLSGPVAVRKTIRAGTNLIGEPTAVLFRKNFLKIVGEFDGAMPYLIDLDFWCRLLLHGDVYILPESMCAFRVSSKSLSVGMVHRQSSDFRKLLKKMADEPRYRLRILDRACGAWMSVINQVLRQLFYTLLALKRRL